MAAASASRAAVHGLRRNPPKSRAPRLAALLCPARAKPQLPLLSQFHTKLLIVKPRAQICQKKKKKLVNKTHREDALSSAVDAIFHYIRRGLGALKWTEMNVWAWRTPPRPKVASSPTDVWGPGD